MYQLSFQVLLMLLSFPKTKKCCKHSTNVVMIYAVFYFLINPLMKPTKITWNYWIAFASFTSKTTLMWLTKTFSNYSMIALAQVLICTLSTWSRKSLLNPFSITTLPIRTTMEQCQCSLDQHGNQLWPFWPLEKWSNRKIPNKILMDHAMEMIWYFFSKQSKQITLLAICILESIWFYY